MFYKKITTLIQNLNKYNSEDLSKVINYLEILILNDTYARRVKKKKLINKLKLLKAVGNKNNRNVNTIAALSRKCVGVDEYIPRLLGVSEYKCHTEDKFLYSSDIFCIFAEDNSTESNAVLDAYKHSNSELFRLDYGFISSKEIPFNSARHHSIIISPDVMYYDAQNESAMERDLKSSAFELNNEQIKRAKQTIALILETKVTKYNHSPIKTLDVFRGYGAKKKLLLVDEVLGDASIEKGLASQQSFERMWQDAIKLEDHIIFVKMHPDAVSGGKESCLSKVLPDNLPENVHLIQEDINPYSVLEHIDKVFVCVSQLGFEALLMNKEVHTYGVSFYSGWGLTKDKVLPVRNRKTRNLYDLFHIFYIEYSRYFVPEKGIVEIETMIKYLSVVEPIENETIHNKTNNFLLIIPSGRFGATGRYFQVIAKYLKSIGHNVMVLCEAYENKIYEDIKWLKLDFDSIRLNVDTMSEIKNFSPDVIYENGVRTRAQRAAIEVSLVTGAKIVIQSEDDDIQVYLNKHPTPDISLIKLMDKPNITINDIKCFAQKNNWEYTFKMLSDPNFDRWIDPFLRNIINQMSVFNTAIWYPFRRRLEKEFKKPTFVVPPVVNTSEYKYFKYDRNLLPCIFKKYNISDNDIVLFLGGTIYDYSIEFEIFLEALNILSKKSKNFSLTLVTVSTRTSLNVKKVCQRILQPSVKHIDLGKASDSEYLLFLQYSDLICSPGVPDDFNLYRMPSRLVKAMAIGKPVLTTKVGFGESLVHNSNAIIIDTSDPVEWSKSMSVVFDLERLHQIGINGREFALKNFDVKKTIDKLLIELRKHNVI